MTYIDKTPEEILTQGLFELGINDINGKCTSALLSYIEELKMFNSAFNLVKSGSGQEIAAAHVLDSLAAWKFFDTEIQNFYEKSEEDASSGDQDFLIADVGSGAGFPGIPLAVLFSIIQPKVKFVLIERMTKRCAMLLNAAAMLSLKNVEVFETEIEKAPAKKYNIVTCRAFTKLNIKSLNALTRLIKYDGNLFLYKASAEKILQEMEIIKGANLICTEKPLTVPFLNRRRSLLNIRFPI